MAIGRYTSNNTKSLERGEGKKLMVILYCLTLTKLINYLGDNFDNLLYTKPLSDLKISSYAAQLSLVRISTGSHYQYI